ncbi:hypothetical protein DCAR_0730349 [Daucus carota subsp. sativus]|uniref:EGF-like calcium-binding domain-containing protein n=1 Tax=Daucus carota subsp. sativus TaxID=79200 RepID=A0AAF0XPR1_DAUCS|nr:hypothetical protein DCAR_0730349 [Daucus carota subsp. sativus]
MRVMHGFLVCVWFVMNAGCCLGRFVVEKNSLRVTSPPELRDTYECAIGNFGVPENITVPSALISKSLGDNIKKALFDGEMVTINLDWRECLPHPDDRVEYEFWTNSNDECGPKCDSQIEFVKKGYTRFTPHYITWYCPQAFILSKQCQSQCINNGRYCAPDPDGDFDRGYDGKDVVIQNLRQACVFKVAKENSKPWIWWDYVTDFSIRCPMKENKYNKECADTVVKSLGVDLGQIDECMGDPNADVENPILTMEQEAQVGKGSRGDVTILPTLLINNRQYRGKLDKGAVLKAICSGFEEMTEPAVCLSKDIETNECLENNGGCWQDKAANLTACKGTFRGRVCECPIVRGIKLSGDGYTHCEPSGALHCGINNGGCWRNSQDGRAYSACVDDRTKGCMCPLGFRGDGVSNCEDVDECKEKLACQCPEGNCKNTWGSYDCTCNGNLLYMRERDTCIIIYLFYIYHSCTWVILISWSSILMLGLGPKLELKVTVSKPRVPNSYCTRQP